MFPLIQLPRKSEGWLTPNCFLPMTTRVSINSTSEEVRSLTLSPYYITDTRFPLIQLPRKSEAVEITLRAVTQKFPLIQLPRKSEVLSNPITDESFIKFPLIQLPRKSEDLQPFPVKIPLHVSINSTSEEVRSRFSPDLQVPALCFH